MDKNKKKEKQKKKYLPPKITDLENNAALGDLACGSGTAAASCSNGNGGG